MEKILAPITYFMSMCFAVMTLVSIGLPSFAQSPINISLLEVSELQRNAAKDNTILDARPKTEYEKGHIPGAIPFSWEDYTETDAKGVKYRIWSSERLAKALQELGIDENTPIVVYGDADKSWGGEAWVCWMFAWLGHKAEIRLLNGGIQAWKAANGTLEQGAFQNKRQKSHGYTVTLNNAINITAQELLAAKDVNIIDVRSNMEWLLGRIPNAVHIPWERFYAGSDHHMIPAAEFQKLMSEYKTDATRKTVYYCTGGIRSAWAWLAHTLATGRTPVNFEGGIEEWNKLK